VSPSDADFSFHAPDKQNRATFAGCSFEGKYRTALEQRMRSHIFVMNLSKNCVSPLCRSLS